MRLAGVRTRSATLRHRALMVAVRAISVLVLAASIGERPVWAAEAVQHLQLDRFSRSYDVHDDLTYVETIRQDATLLTRRGIAAGERETMDFYPKSQSLELVEAWVDLPDGARLPVDPSAIFTRPSQESQSAPGFSDSQTTTVVFPQLREGSHTHVVWKLTQKTPPLIGLQITAVVPEEWTVSEMVVEIKAPESVPLHYARRGGFAVEDNLDHGVRKIRAYIATQIGTEPERNAVSPLDFQPLFLVTSQPNLEALGAVYYSQSHDRSKPTPKIEALAAQIAGDRTGLEAAKAIYNWVALNIRYVAIYLDENDGWVPHPAEDVLARGYGDCKDHVAIMQALLAARGIEAQPALIDWGKHFAELPLWVSQFNHAIIYLPDYNRFLNPTNPYARFDALDPTLSGKLVAIASEKGRVSHTPMLRPEDNLYKFNADIRVDAEGTIEGKAAISMSAYSEASFRSAVANAVSPEDLAEQLLRGMPEGGFGRYITSAPRDLTQPFAIEARWRSRHGTAACCASAALPVPLGLDIARPALLRTYLTRDGERRHPASVSAKDLNWSETIHLPAGQRPVAVPHDLTVENAVGFYRAHYAVIDGGVQVERRLVVNRTVIQPSEVTALETLIYTALDDVRATVSVAPAAQN